MRHSFSPFFSSPGVAKTEPVTLDTFVQAETGDAIQLIYDRVGLDHP